MRKGMTLMNTNRQIHSSLKVLVVSDIERARNYYSEVLGCEVTDWWVLRDGFTGLAIKLLEAREPKEAQSSGKRNGAGIRPLLLCGRLAVIG